MTEIGAAAGKRKSVEPAVLQQIMDAARKAPLQPEPFVVRGVQAQIAGDPLLAERAFRAAELRDGRSIPAHYFLAEQYFRRGQADRGLREISMLARLVPGGAEGLAPYIAAYARQPSSWLHLKAVFKTDHALQDAVLTSLAADAHNAGLIIGLWDGSRPNGQPPVWSTRLLRSLVDAGQYATAYNIWTTVARVRPQSAPLLFDPGFEGSAAPEPFNWGLTSSTVGLAERHPPGQLHVLFYGQEDGVLASQLLLLKPGRYHFALRLSGDTAHARLLGWTLTCKRASNPIMTLPLTNPAVAARGVSFEVPADCPAQSLELTGHAPDLPQQADVTLGNLSLSRE